jgi:hypothetical protein
VFGEHGGKSGRHVLRDQDRHALQNAADFRDQSVERLRPAGG